MTSTGNDIVAIKAINITRTHQQKFYSKILSDTEIPLYNEFNLAGIPFEIFVWLLWSVKESAYKFLQRHNPALIFTPVKFVVESLVISPNYCTSVFSHEIESKGFSVISTISGCVSYSDYRLHSRSIINNAFIMTVVNQDANFDDVYWGIKTIGETSASNQSEQV